jgi:hypothetical protein
MGAGMPASPDANRVQTICSYVRRAAVCPGQGDAASITTQSMAGKYCAQRSKRSMYARFANSYFEMIPTVPSHVSTN